MIERIVNRQPYESYLDGLARIVDIHGLLNEHYKELILGDDADFKAIYSDWEAIGDDLIKVYEMLISEYSE